MTVAAAAARTCGIAIPLKLLRRLGGLGLAPPVTTPAGAPKPPRSSLRRGVCASGDGSEPWVAPRAESAGSSKEESSGWPHQLPRAPAHHLLMVSCACSSVCETQPNVVFTF